MFTIQPIILVGAVFAVGVLHTMVPDHWAPIALLARQHKWSKRETRTAAFKAGVGHVVSTLLIGLLVWAAGVAFATKFGNAIDTISSIALVGFGLWFAVTAYIEMKHEHHSHPHAENEPHRHDHHGHDSSRTALLLIIGSSPMVEGIPAFFAASAYGVPLLAVMALVFAASTIATYVILCTYSSERLQQTSLGVFECYGEVLSGAFIAFIGFVFLALPLL